MIRLAKAVFGTEFTITVKAGFRITNLGGELVAVTKDIDFVYSGSTIARKYSTATVTTSNANVSDIKNNDTIEFGQTYNFTVSADEGYTLTSVTINGAEQGTGGSYSFTANGSDVSIVVTTTPKTYTATVTTTNASVNGVSNNQNITHDQTYNFTVSANSGYQLTSVTINGVEQGTGGSYSFTVSGAVAIVVTTTPNTYKATVTTTNASVNGVSNNQNITHDQTYNFTVSANSGYQLTSVTINGVEQGMSGSYSFTASGATSIVVTAKKLYAVTWSNPTGATISVTANGSTISSGATVVEGTSISVTVTASSGYRLNTVTIGGAAQSGVSTSQAGSSTFNYTVNAATSISATTVKMYTVSWTATNANYTVTNTTTGATISTSGTWVDTGTNISVKVAAKTGYNITGVTINNSSVGTAAGTFTHTVTSNTTIKNTAESSGICIVEGTMILMADGTQNAVEDLALGDMLMVYDHFNGTFAARPFVMDVHAVEPANSYSILNMIFSNGATWRIAGHHTIFDSTLNEYVTITLSNVDEYVGHKFYYTDGVTGEAVTLTNYYVTEEVVKIFSPTTYEFANYFANGFLNAPPLPDTLTAGQMNCFEFGENMTYVNVQEDIEEYGLYTYEDFADYISEDVFNALPFKYFKVSVGKGLLTWEEIVALISMV